MENKTQVELDKGLEAVTLRVLADFRQVKKNEPEGYVYRTNPDDFAQEWINTHYANEEDKTHYWNVYKGGENYGK